MYGTISQALSLHNSKKFYLLGQIQGELFLFSLRSFFCSTIDKSLGSSSHSNAYSNSGCLLLKCSTSSCWKEEIIILLFTPAEIISFIIISASLMVLDLISKFHSSLLLNLISSSVNFGI